MQTIMIIAAILAIAALGLGITAWVRKPPTSTEPEWFDL
jgi:hypothetical protein